MQLLLNPSNVPCHRNFYYCYLINTFQIILYTIYPRCRDLPRGLFPDGLSIKNLLISYCFSRYTCPAHYYLMNSRKIRMFCLLNIGFQCPCFFPLVLFIIRVSYISFSESFSRTSTVYLRHSLLFTMFRIIASIHNDQTKVSSIEFYLRFL